MHREYIKWFSPSLHRNMEMLVFGHGGAPLLVFPALAEEKVAEVVAWNERQRRILDRSCTFLAE